eukprot:6201543-Pleurochrysis_carterae.AAC.1
MGVDKLPKQCTAIGDLHLLAVDVLGVSRPILLCDVRCAPSFHDTLLSVSRLCAERGARCEFGKRNQLGMPADASGHRPSFALQRNGGLYELRAQLLPQHASRVALSPPRSLT